MKPTISNEKFLKTGDSIPVSKPLLPDSTKILPYLKKIDENQWYSNFGPLVYELHERFEELFSSGKGSVISLSNGTAGLTNSIRVLDLPQKTYCILPSWTFAATAAAVCSAGLIPYFVDVDEESWSIEPETVYPLINKLDLGVSLVLVVAPFGAPPEIKKWEEFSKKTDIKVIIDAAASFDSIHLNKESCISETIPIMISLHATKTFGCGEGGIVVCKDKNLIDGIKKMSNFGFAEGRQIVIPGTNGKMSEYTAAVALAELDHWEEKRTGWKKVTDTYIEQLDKADIKHRLSKKWVSSSCVLTLDSKFSPTEMVEKLVQKNINSRRWWDNGCHNLKAYRKYGRTQLPITEKLAGCAISPPFYTSLEKDKIEYIVKNIKELSNK
jgi:dTDP-4-amino-4,6-dideoxygalactose transaminase